MAANNNIYSIIVPAQTPNMTAHTYNMIYGGNAGCTIVVNGVSVNVAACSNIPITINTVSGGNGCFLLGENKDVYLGSPNL
jgi:hypothetical protein